MYKDQQDMPQEGFFVQIWRIEDRIHSETFRWIDDLLWCYNDMMDTSLALDHGLEVCGDTDIPEYECYYRWDWLYRQVQDRMDDYNAVYILLE